MLLHVDVVKVVHVFLGRFEDVPIVSDRLEEVAGDRGIGVDGVGQQLRRRQWQHNINRKENPLIQLEQVQLMMNAIVVS